MADLTLAQRFGSNVVFDEANGELTIKLADLADDDGAGNGDFTNGNGLDVSGMTDANKDEYSTRILWALVQLSFQNQPETNNDETVNAYISNNGKRTIIRNSVSQFGFQMAVTAYINDNLGITLDPDSIGA